MVCHRIWAEFTHKSFIRLFDETKASVGFHSHTDFVSKSIYAFRQQNFEQMSSIPLTTLSRNLIGPCRYANTLFHINFNTEQFSQQQYDRHLVSVYNVESPCIHPIHCGDSVLWMPTIIGTTFCNQIKMCLFLARLMDMERACVVSRTSRYVCSL